MKLSMWSSFYRELSPYDMILELEKAGYHYTELSTEHADMLLAEGDAIEVGKKFGEFAKAHNVEVAANGIVSSPFPSGINGKIFELSKFKNATIMNKAKNSILNTVTKD